MKCRHNLRQQLLIRGLWFSVFLGWVCLASIETLAAQGNSSLSDLDIEISETKITLQTIAEENQLLRSQLELKQKSVASLAESLAIANSEAEVFRRQYGELKLRMEALGVDGVSSDKSKLEQRLLKAVRDLQLVQKEKEKLADQLVMLSEAVIRFLKSAVSTDSDARLSIETQMRDANEALGITSSGRVEDASAVGSLMDGAIVSIKEEYSLVIANMGSKQGVKIGMPFQVWCGGEQIGLVRVVDVREKISAAVIQNLKSDKQKIKVGDRLRVDAQ